MPKIRLFEKEAVEKYLKRANRNRLAQELLNEITARNLILKHQAKTTDDAREKARRDYYVNTYQDRKPLAIRIYSRQGVIYSQYPYPFRKGGFIERSTGIRLKKGSTLTAKGTRLVHPGISYLVPLLEFERDEIILSQSRAFPELDFLFCVENPRELVRKLSGLELDHAYRLCNEIKKAIEGGANAKTVKSMKSRLRIYAPQSFEVLINELRVLEGKEPIFNNLSELLRLEKKDERALKTIKKKMQSGR